MKPIASLTSVVAAMVPSFSVHLILISLEIILLACIIHSSCHDRVCSMPRTIRYCSGRQRRVC